MELGGNTHFKSICSSCESNFQQKPVGVQNRKCLNQSLLDFDAPRNIAFCPLSGKEKSLADFGTIKVVSKTNISDYRTRYNLDPLVKGKVEKELEVEATRQRAVVDEECPKCGNQGVEFFTMQLRSADEGSTVFYECKECGYKWSQNN